jgi:hypothetical protein
MVLFGVPHHAQLIVTCGECVAVDPGFRASHPEAAAVIDKWLAE